MSDARDDLVAAREAYRSRRWPQAYELFHAAGPPDELAPDDAAALSESAWWLGRVDAGVEAGSVAFRGFLAEGRTRQAAMTAVGVAVWHLLRGDDAAGAGWVGRASRLLAEDEGARHLSNIFTKLDLRSRTAVASWAHRHGLDG